VLLKLQSVLAGARGASEGISTAQPSLYRRCSTTFSPPKHGLSSHSPPFLLLDVMLACPFGERKLLAQESSCSGGGARVAGRLW
jgi:hypothetical protein